MTEVMKLFDDNARAEIHIPIYDEETQTVCTPESKREEKHYESFFAAGWRVDMTKVKSITGSMEERPNPNAIVLFKFEDVASVGTIHQGDPIVHGIDAEEISTSTLGTMRLADAIESMRKQNELIA